MIPNGKEMNWNGHHLVFESENDPCRGCFFADKDECPECDEGLWVEENPSPWHTGTPTIDDPFLIKEVFILLFIHPSGETWNYHAHLFKPDFKQKCFYSWCDKRIKFHFDTEGLLWQKIEPYK